MKHFSIVFFSLLFMSVAVSCDTCGASSASESAAAELPDPTSTPPALLSVFVEAFPGVTFDPVYDEAASDWRITLTLDDRTDDFYWADGKMLTPEEEPYKESYGSMLHVYNPTLRDPKDYSDEERERARNFGLRPPPRDAQGNTPQRMPWRRSSAFYTFIYDSADRASVERHIVNIPFLGKISNAHERLREPLANVDREIRAAAQTDSEVRDFIDSLESADSYSWRNVRNSSNRSYHSLGIAVDVLPDGWERTNIYWAWRRDIDPEWMLLPLAARWMPPQKVIDIFQDNGFIWGGYWPIWDNMHFEYHPEIIAYTKLQEGDAASSAQSGALH